MTNNMKKRFGPSLNSRVGNAGTVRMSSQASGMATQYRGMLDHR